METPYSKQDEAIEVGAKALREQVIDTPRMMSVLNSVPRRSVVLPVGLATAAACVLGAIVLMTPTKADAGQFDKVREAVKGQPAVFERVMKPGKKDNAWELRWETWKDGSKSGVKMPAKGGTYEVVLDGKKMYEKNPKQAFFEVELVDPIQIEDTKLDLNVTKKIERLDLVEIELVDAELVLAEHEPQTINEILARDGMEFLNVKRAQKKEGRACDIYSVRMGKDENETLYYVDRKTDLPFLKEEVDPNGMVIRRIEIDFPGEITLDVKMTRGDQLFEVVPRVNKVEGRLMDKVRLQGGEFRVRLDTKKIDPPKTDHPKINP
jgi:hypothetical protein